ncbi:acyl CoA:acetate/3-ketoacid CoA transferase [Tepidibacter hydrothermalis]|uniref:CoA-transferase n=1 Tax=Tepidibacter hydrothermalis TaxID=3036126 RepID=A0ABY8EBK9_9FIRM|nr:CoA-transferase [Tepidibacter hydrothermalis]WFD10313.1 CoA-transferase [Tepidibacter hydrothermalis]
MAKFISSREAIDLIKEGNTVGVGGFVGFSIPEELLTSLEDKYVNEGCPKNLTVFNCAGIGDKNGRGMDHFAHEGLVKKLYCGHVGLAPKLGELAAQNKFPAYMVPQGVACHLVKAIASGSPGLLTHVGLKTFADPRLEGCKANKAAEKEDIVELMNIDDKDYLFYKSFPIDVCFIKATTADEKGNLSLEKEAVRADQLSIATATKNSGGIVIAQVEKVCRYDSLKAADVAVHSHLVDYVVLGSHEHNVQSFATKEYIPEWSGEIRGPSGKLKPVEICPKKIIGKRGAFDLKKGGLINLGIGVPEYVAMSADEENISNEITLTIESGVMGGVPASGLGIGATYNPDAIHVQEQIFDLYDGGGIDVAYLGAAEIDKDGNVNVSKFGGKVVGPGGFINISQNAKKVVFCGTFKAGGLKTEIANGKITILQEGRSVKFKDTVEQITFSADYAKESGQEILYITERAVFKLTDNGPTLIEIAPGIDLQKDILDQMEFKPCISDDLKEMDLRIFIDEKMNIEI